MTNSISQRPAFGAKLITINNSKKIGGHIKNLFKRSPNKKLGDVEESIKGINAMDGVVAGKANKNELGFKVPRNSFYVEVQNPTKRASTEQQIEKDLIMRHRQDVKIEPFMGPIEKSEIQKQIKDLKDSKKTKFNEALTDIGAELSKKPKLLSHKTAGKQN